MGKKRRTGQLEAAAAPPQPAEPKPEAIAISADDAAEAKPAEVAVVKGEVKSEEAKTEEVTRKRKIEQCGDGDVEKIEPPTKKRRKKKKKKKKKKSSEVSELEKNAVANGVADDAVVAKQNNNKKRKKQLCAKEKVEEKPKLVKCLDVCVICRQKGHMISTCPLLSQTEDGNEKSGNKLPDCPQPLQDVDLETSKAEKLLGCPLVETYGAEEDESMKNGEESSCTPVDVFLKDQKSDGRGDNAIVSVDSGSHPEEDYVNPVA